MTSLSDHWGFFQLPPFFTEQPAPATLERQITLWSALILDHAAYHARQSKSEVCPVLRLYSTSSDVFYNPKLRRRLPPAAARTMLEGLVSHHPNHAVAISAEDDSADDFAVLVATNAGGLRALEQSLLSWILEMGQGTTTAMLSKKGAVMTFNELADGKCLQYKQEPLSYLARSSSEAIAVADFGGLDEEQAIRAFLSALNTRPVSVMQPFKITLFNLDGSTKQPYQGVKFGGD